MSEVANEGAGAPAATLESFEIQRLLELLPHRYPFLMVDRIRDIDADLSCVGVKNVTVNEPHFAGHFPGRPIMPGVLLLEGMAQTAGAICVAATLDGVSPQALYFMTIDKAKFRRPVVPGDVVEYHIHRVRRRGWMWWYRGEARVAGVLVAEAVVSAALAAKGTT